MCSAQNRCSTTRHDFIVLNGRLHEPFHVAASEKRHRLAFRIMVACNFSQTFPSLNLLRDPFDTSCVCVICDVFLCFQLNQWPRAVSAKFHYTIYPITFSVGNADEWKKLFKPCAAQRLFLPVRLLQLSALISSPCIMSLTSVKTRIGVNKFFSFLLEQRFFLASVLSH